MIHWYKEETGVKEVDMHKVAEFAAEKGMDLPRPKNPMDILAHQLGRAARDEMGKDGETGRPYRVNHAYTVTREGQQTTLWVDIKDATRKQMHMSLMLRREQMIGDGLQLTFDAEFWNKRNPADEPIQVPLDFTDDIEWRKNAPKEKAS